MKRIVSLLLVLVFLCLGCAGFAAGNFKNVAQEAVLVISFMMDQIMGEKVMFDRVQTVEEGAAYRFGSDRTDVSILVVKAEDSENAEKCVITGTKPKDLDVACMSSCCLAPHAMLYMQAPGADDSIEQMIALTNWFDGHMDNLRNALHTGKTYTAEYTDSEFFRVELQINLPENGENIIQINHYLWPLAD